MMSPAVSIIIPCYNSGLYLKDALDSIKDYRGKHTYEVIIINDGSTDQDTLVLLDQLQKEKYVVLHQENKGPASARNTGIKNSKGEYILFLDSDNKIKGTYINKGVEILQLHKQVGIVYGNFSLFGEISQAEKWVPEFDMQRLLASNFIDMCTMIRKKVWEDIGGFDEARIVMGHEDWDFWIRAGKTDWKFYHVKEVMFDYRVRPNSLLQQARQPEKYQEMLRYVYSKHLDLVITSYKSLSQQYRYYKSDQQKPFRSFFKFFYQKYISKKDTMVKIKS